MKEQELREQNKSKKSGTKAKKTVNKFVEESSDTEIDERVNQKSKTSESVNKNSVEKVEQYSSCPQNGLADEASLMAEVTSDG